MHGSSVTIRFYISNLNLYILHAVFQATTTVSTHIRTAGLSKHGRRYFSLATSFLDAGSRG